MNRQQTGKLGEELAREYLKKHGYRILETNYRCGRGKIPARNYGFLYQYENRFQIRATDAGDCCPGYALSGIALRPKTLACAKRGRLSAACPGRARGEHVCG